MNFQDMGILPEVLKSIEELGYTEPTEFQVKSIPVLNNTEKDFVGQSHTGTGKTAAFVVPLLNRINFESRKIQALIITPTRELAHQVENEISKLGKYTQVKSACVYGGTAYEKQIANLEKTKPQIVVGTPGRLIDMIEKGHLDLADVDYCVLDEADEMLTMGFLEDVHTILDSVKNEKQLFMFSATMPKAILKLIARSFGEHNIVKIEKESVSNEDIDQKYFVVRDKFFKEALARLIDNTSDLYGIVFCRTKIETKEVGDDLKKRGRSVEVLNGDMGQLERDQAMRNFKSKRVNILVCTDVAARGIDIANLTHVFNYGPPRDNESYVHRIGRTGRAGLKGSAFTIIGHRSESIITKLERHINKKIEKSKLPTLAELKQKLVERELDGVGYILEAIRTKGDDFKIEESFSMFKDHFSELSDEELLKVMFVWKFNKEMRHYNNLTHIEDIPKDKPNKAPKKSRADRIQKSRDDKKSPSKKSFNRGR
jgi:ATP-dependent RNA helicase DeaD